MFQENFWGNRKTFDEKKIEEKVLRKKLKIFEEKTLLRKQKKFLERKRKKIDEKKFER